MQSKTPLSAIKYWTIQHYLCNGNNLSEANLMRDEAAGKELLFSSTRDTFEFQICASSEMIDNPRCRKIERRLFAARPVLWITKRIHHFRVLVRVQFPMTALEHANRNASIATIGAQNAPRLDGMRATLACHHKFDPNTINDLSLWSYFSHKHSLDKICYVGTEIKRV